MTSCAARHVVHPDLPAAQGRAVLTEMHQWTARTRTVRCAGWATLCLGTPCAAAATVLLAGTFWARIAGALAALLTVVVAVAVLSAAGRREWDVSDGLTAPLARGPQQDVWQALGAPGLWGGREHRELWSIALASDHLRTLNQSQVRAVRAGGQDGLARDATVRATRLTSTLEERVTTLSSTLTAQNAQDAQAVVPANP